MNQDLVSVIMPVFNGERFLKDAIESVLGQTYKNIELLIINDGSTDYTNEIISNFKSNKFVVYIDLNENVGVAEARNIGLRHAKGKYIAFIDSDDIWCANKLDIQLCQMKQKNLNYSFSYYKLIDENKNLLKIVNKIPSRATYQSLIKRNYIPMLTVMVSSELIRNYRFNSVGHEDYALWLELFRTQNVRAEACGQVLAKYRVHDSSISANKIQSARWVWHLYRKQEKMSFMSACINWMCYVWYGIKKHSY
ncbi:glycosyl transferase family 2 [Lactiplantibacillus plantarum]|nr:glycosyl transferase family 2 [Lactiplantibacillus plantarum]